MEKTGFWNFEIVRVEEFYLTPGNILSVIITILLTKLALRIIKRIYYSEKKFVPNISRKQASFSLTKYFVWSIVALFILASVGIKLSLLLAGGTALLVVLGLGINQIFYDFVSGIIILFEGNVEIGDIIEVNGLIGKVKKISVRTSELVTRDDVDIIVPNSKMIGDNVINWSHNQKLTRFHIDIGVSYDSDIKLVSEVLMASARDFDEIAVTPRPFVMFKDYGDSQLNFSLFFWTDEVFRIEILMSKIRFQIWEQFKAFDIKVPFPQRDLHIKSSVQELTKPINPEPNK